MITAYQRGHSITYINDRWVYADDRTTISKDRRCIRCKQYPTIEGYDRCLGYIAGVKSACCGHGVEEVIREINEQ